MATDLPILEIITPHDWQEWLNKNSVTSNGVLLKIPKKASGLPPITHDQVLDIALCYGWIDGQRNRFDDNYFIQKFTPRRSRSLWSKRNIEKVESLIAAGKMLPGGTAEIEAAKADGRWEAAYDSPKNMTTPEELVQALENNKKAKATYETLSRTNTYAIAFSINTAKKAETRQRRIEKFVAMLERGEKLY